jgi:tetratricopeptide (TPR) repeat protein
MNCLPGLIRFFPVAVLMFLAVINGQASAAASNEIDSIIKANEDRISGIIEIRTDDTVYLKDRGAPLVGNIVYQNDRELKIEAGKVAQIISASNVRKIVLRQDAELSFKRALALYSKKGPADLYLLAVAALSIDKSKMLDNAVKALEAGKKINSKHAEIRLLLGHLYIQRGELAAALIEAKGSVESSPDNPSCQVLLALVYNAQGDASKAMVAVKKVLSQKLSSSHKIDVAEVLLSMGETQEARKTIDQALAQDPRNIRAKLLSGKTYLAEADLAQAEPLLTEAVKGLRAESEPYLALAALQYLQGNLSAARKNIGAAISYGGGADCFSLKALVQLRDGKIDEAIKSAGRAQAMAPNRSRVATTKAVIDLIGGQLDEGLAALDAPIKKAGTRCRDAYVFYLRGHIQFKKGSFNEAMVSFSRAGDLTTVNGKPTWSEAYVSAATSALNAGKWRDAERFFGIVSRLNKSSAPAFAGLGLALLGQVGRSEEADGMLRKALELDSKSAEAHLGLGFLANKQKREAEAIGFFRKASSLPGGSEYAAVALQKLRAARGENASYYYFDDPALPAGWVKNEKYGIFSKIKTGKLFFTGKQQNVGGRNTQVFVRMDPRNILGFTIDVNAKPRGGMSCGVFVASSGGFIEFGLFENGKLCWRIKNREGYQPPHELGEWPKNGVARLSIELLSHGKGRFRTRLNGRQLGDVTVNTMANSGGCQVGIFCRAQLGEEVNIDFDTATIVRRKGK